jgi:hypothetical protein
MKKFQKGDRVTVRATVFTKERKYRQFTGAMPEVAYEPVRQHCKRGIPRRLMRVPEQEPWEGIVVGYSKRWTGFHMSGRDWDDPGWIGDQVAHEVVMVIPTDRVLWERPLPCLEADLEPLNDVDPGPDSPERGLYQKFAVRRLHDPNGRHKDCRYYVLDLDHDPYTTPALEAYIEACENEYPALAQDLSKIVQQGG